jgi:small membrane protein
MQVFIIQIIAALFVIFAISRAYLRFREKKLSSFSFIFWTIVWIAGIGAIIFPEISTSFARVLGVGRGVDAILYASIVILFYMIFRLYIKIEDTQRQITELVRKVALKTPTLKKKHR